MLRVKKKKKYTQRCGCCKGKEGKEKRAEEEDDGTGEEGQEGETRRNVNRKRERKTQRKPDSVKRTGEGFGGRGKTGRGEKDA